MDKPYSSPAGYSKRQLNEEEITKPEGVCTKDIINEHKNIFSSSELVEACAILADSIAKAEASTYAKGYVCLVINTDLVRKILKILKTK